MGRWGWEAKGVRELVLYSLVHSPSDYSQCLATSKRGIRNSKQTSHMVAGIKQLELSFDASEDVSGGRFETEGPELQLSL